MYRPGNPGKARKGKCWVERGWGGGGGGGGGGVGRFMHRGPGGFLVVMKSDARSRALKHDPPLQYPRR